MKGTGLPGLSLVAADFNLHSAEKSILNRSSEPVPGGSFVHVNLKR